MATYEITSPDGEVFEVTAPDGASEADVMAYAQSQFKRSAQPEQAPTETEQPSLASRIAAPFVNTAKAANEVAGTVIEPAMQMGTGMAGSVLGNLAGLATIPAHAVGLTERDPQQVRQSVQDALTYQPKTSGGQFVSQNILAPIGGVIESGAESLADPVRGDASPSDLRGMAGAAVKEGALQATGLLGLKGAPKVAGSLRDSNIAKAAALREQQAVDAMRNRIRTEGQSIGLIAPPDSFAKQTISRIGGAEPHVAAKNTQTATNAIADEIGLPKGAISDLDIAAKVKSLSDDYGLVTKALGQNVPIKLDFKRDVNAMLAPMKAKFAQDPKAFAALKGAIDLLEQQVAPIRNAQGAMVKQEIPSSIVMDKIRQLRSDARKYDKDTTGDPSKSAMAESSYKLANLYEDLMENVLAQQGKKALLDKFRDSRKKLAQIHVIDAARTTDGLIDMQKLASVTGKYGADKKMVSGKIKTVADFANTFRSVSKPATKEQFSTPTRFEALVSTGAVVGAPMTGGASLLAALPTASRIVAPVMAERGMLQGKTPSYDLSLRRRMAPEAARAGMLGAAFSPYIDEDQP